MDQHTERVLSKKAKKKRQSTTKPRRRRQEVDEPEQYFAAKSILDEKLEGGKLRFLVDWEDNPTTGETYDPTWESEENCTEALITSWRERQGESATENTAQPSSLESTAASEAIHPTKRKRVTLDPPSSSTSQIPPPSKKPRRAGTAESARFQSVQQEIVESEGVRNEIKDSYEDEEPSLSGEKAGNLRVEVEVPEGFDRTEYRTILSSQPSQPSKRTEDSQQSPARTPASLRPYLWDEDIEQDPDNLPDSLSYRPSASLSRTEGTPCHNTQTASDTNTEIVESGTPWTLSHSALQSSDEFDSQLAESRSQSSRAQGSYTQGDEPSSTETDPAVGSQSSDELAESVTDQPSTVQSASLFASANNHSLEYVADQEGEECSNQVPQHEPQSESHFSFSIPFQTRLPASSHETPSPLQSIRTLQSSPVYSQYAQVVEQTLQLDSSPRLQSQPSQRPNSSPLNSDVRSGQQITTPLNSPQLENTKSQKHNPRSQLIATTESEDSHSLARVSSFDQHRLPLSTPGRQSLGQSSSAPTPPRTPPSAPRSVVEMEQSTPTPSSGGGAKARLADIMSKKKAEIAARHAARAASSISPSPAPPATPAPLATSSQNLNAFAANLMLPVFAPAASPIPPELRQSAKATPELEVEPSLNLLAQGANEYIVPLPMVSHPRDIYVQTIKNYKIQRNSFLTDEVFEEALVGEIETMMNELERLCDHQDLIESDLSTQRQMSTAEQAKWAENVSTKCIFLAEFLPLIKHAEKHVVILVRPGRMLEILESLFQWHELVYSRADRPGWSGNNPGMKITLLPTGGEKYSVEPASLVIAFDSTSKSVSYLKDVRADSANPKKLAPLLSLVITHSVEHLEMCFPKNLEHIQRQIKLVLSLSQIMDNVGKLKEGYPDPPEAAKSVAAFVNGTTDIWPIPHIPAIEGIEGIDLRFDETQESNESNHHPTPIAEEDYRSSIKRQLEDETISNTDSPKRQRLTPVPGDHGNSEMSHTSDTVIQSSARANIGVTNDDQVSSLLKRITDLERRLREKENTEHELRRINQDLETRCQDYESSNAEIIPKYQEALNDRGKFEHDMKHARASEAHMRKERDTRDSELTKLREQKAAVDAELTEARLALATSAIPGVAELQNMKNELERINSELDRAQKRSKNMQQEVEYMRTQYQNSSSAAVDAVAELRAANEKIAKLTEQVDSNRVQIHEIQRNSESAQHLRTIKELRTQKEMLEAELEKKDAELKAILNVRRATRGTSVPRSPRMGSTMSPGPRPISNRVMQMGSRGNSPAPGDFGPVRGDFGGPLFQQGPSGTARWGNHLQ